MNRFLLYALVSSLILAFACKQSNLTDIQEKSPLPRSMKGYELYSWIENGEWCFRLVTGTNRAKRYDEIFADDNVVDNNGMVTIKDRGVEALKNTLRRLLAGETVMWSDGRFLAGEKGNQPDLTFPGQEIVTEIGNLCIQIGISLDIVR